MSLYFVQKVLYALNRDPAVQARFRTVIAVNGQILMRFAALMCLAWPDYIEAMREGVRRHGPVRVGVYAMTTGIQEKVAGL